jgi:hypothetical protein
MIRACDAPDRGNVGHLAGNLPWGVYLLIPLVLGFALLTALALGSGAAPPPTRRSGGASRALRHEGEDRRASD